MSGLEGISSSRARLLFDDDGEDDRAEQLRRRLASPADYAARDSDARELVALEQRAAIRSDIEHGRLRAAPAKPPPIFEPPAPKLSPHAGAPAHESLMAPFDAKSSSDELLDRRRMQIERALGAGGALLPPVRAALEKNLAAARAEVEQREQGKPFDPWKGAPTWARAGRDLDGGIARACGTNADRCLADAQLAIGAATLTVVTAGVATEVATPALLAYGATAGEAALGAELIANTASTTAGYAASGAPASPEQATAEAAIGVVLPGMRLGVASGEARALGGAWQNGKPAGLIVRSGDCLTVPLPRVLAIDAQLEARALEVSPAAPAGGRAEASAGPGAWMRKAEGMSKSSARFQEKVTGVRAGTGAYVIAGQEFDGFRVDRTGQRVVLEAKDHYEQFLEADGTPKRWFPWQQDPLAKVLRQAKIAESHGCVYELHVSQARVAERLAADFDRLEPKNTRLILETTEGPRVVWESKKP